MENLDPNHYQQQNYMNATGTTGYQSQTGMNNMNAATSGISSANNMGSGSNKSFTKPAS